MAVFRPALGDLSVDGSELLQMGRFAELSWAQVGEEPLCIVSVVCSLYEVYLLKEEICILH